MNAIEYWQSIRQMLDHENTLVNSRYTWMLATQSLLFAALGVFWEKEAFVEITICIVGLVSTASVAYILRLANHAMWNLVDDWQKYLDTHKVGEFPPIYGLRKKYPQFAFPWLLVPPIVCFAWLVIFIWRLCNICT